MDERPTRKRKNVDYGDMMNSGDGVPQQDDEKPFEQPIDKEDDKDNDEDLVFVEDDKSANQPMDEEDATGDIKLVLRALGLDALRELVESQSVQDDKIETYWSSRDVQDALDVVEMDDPKEDELRAAIAVLLDHAAEVRELRGEDDGPSYAIGSAGARKRAREGEIEASLQKAADDAKKAHAFLADMKARHEKDPEGVAAQFKALIDDESTRPAIEAIIKHGMSATRFRMEHRDAAPERLASMDDEAKTAYLVDACVEIKVYDVFGFTDLHTGEKHEADPGFRWRRPGAVKSGRFRSIEKDLAPSSRWSGKNRAEKLDNIVFKECGTSRDDLRKLNESQKFNMLVEKKREKYVSPFQKISGNHELFEALVAYPTTLDELVRLVKTIVAMAHGDTLFTNKHCVVVDARGVLKRREQYLEAENRGEIRNPENFYSGPGDREDCLETGLKLTRFLQKEEDLPECLKTVRGRISIFGEDDAKLYVDSLLTATNVSQCVVLLGAVRDVENTKEAALGRVVVTCAIEIGSRTELWHVLGTPGHFAMVNPFTINCFMILASIFLPTLALGYRQSPSLVPPVKMVASGDGSVMVGESSDQKMKADVKAAFPKTIRQMDGVFARAVKVIGENQISNASARLLAPRVESASLSGVLQSLESRDDGLGAGFGVNGDALTKLIDSMKDVVDISKAVGPLRHILCSCPTPDPTPPPNPQPQPTNQNAIDLRHGWSHAEWNGWAAEDEDGDG